MMVQDNKTNYELYTESPELLAKAFALIFISGMEAAKGIPPNIVDKVINDKKEMDKYVNSYLSTLMSPCLDYYGIVD